MALWISKNKSSWLTIRDGRAHPGCRRPAARRRVSNRTAPFVFALRAKAAFRCRHWPASFLWSFPANAGILSAYRQPKYQRPPWQQPCGGERNAPVNRGARLARGFTAFFLASSCSPSVAAHPSVGSHRRRARMETINRRPFAPLFVGAVLSRRP